MKHVISKNFFIYSFPGILSRFVNFLTLPVTTSYLALADFGFIAIFQLCIIPFRISTEFGVGYIINSKWFNYNLKQRKELIFSILFTGAIISSFFGVILWLFTDFIFQFLVGDDWGKIKLLSNYLFLYVIILIPNPIFDIWAIIQQKAILNSVIRVIEVVSLTISTVWFAINTQNYELIIISTVYVSLFISLIKYFILFKNADIKFRMYYYKIIFNIGLPILSRSFFRYFRNRFDTIMISNFLGSSTLAIYNFGGRFNQIFEEGANYFSNSYTPIFYKGLAKNNLDINSFRNVFFNWAWIVFFINIFLIIFGESIISLLTNDLFIEAYPLMVLNTTIFILSILFLGTEEILIYKGETLFIFKVTIIQAIIVLTLGFFTIPKFGAVSAIFSIWFGSIIGFMINYIKRKRLFKGNFAELHLFPYVLAFHIAVLLRFFDLDFWFNITTFLLMLTMTVHALKLNKLF